MSSNDFSISMHILTLLDQSEGLWLTSDFMAGSINCNPVLVRKAIISLKKSGFVQSKEGKGGGALLAIPAEKIDLGAVYLSLKQRALWSDRKNVPNPKCPVGRQITAHLHTLYHEAEQAMIQKLSTQTLADFTAKFK